jgi:hypothetical protein
MDSQLLPIFHGHPCQDTVVCLIHLACWDGNLVLSTYSSVDLNIFLSVTTLQTPLSADKLHCHIFYQALLFSVTASSDILLYHVCGVLLVPTITRNNLFWYSTHSGLRQHSYFIIGNYVMGANDPLTATIHLPSS